MKASGSTYFEVHVEAENGLDMAYGKRSVSCTVCIVAMKSVLMLGTEEKVFQSVYFYF